MLRSARGSWWLAAAGLAVSVSAAGAQTVRYVDDSAPAGGDGTSWATALNSLQAGLTGLVAGDEVRVAQGTYAPAAAGGSRTATFLVPSGVAMRGGYAGFGAENPDERDPAVYVTTLTGDLNGNDTPTLGNRTDNSHHVVTTAGTAVVDGFLITAGNADATSNRVGGGLFVPSGSPTIVGCTFYLNQANEVSGAGGGLASFSSQAVTITNCAFIQNSSKYQFNTANGFGGAIYADRAVISQCSFTGNAGNRGGAIYTSVNSTITDCVFSGNTSSQAGALYLGGTAGAAFNITGSTFTANSAGQGGAVEIFNSNAAVHFTDCVFTGNSTSTFGGAINNLGNGMTATRCIFSGNTAGSGGGALTTSSGTALVTNCTIAFNSSSNVTGGLLLSASSSTPSVRNTILWGNSDATGNTERAQIARFFTNGTLPFVNYCDVQGLTPDLGGTGNFDADPLFADALNGDFSLEAGSPCVNAGDPTMLDPDGSAADVGAVRVQNAKPIADAVVTQLTAIGDSAMIRLDATGSSDPDGVTADLAIEWRVNGATVCSGTFATCGVIEVPVAYGTHQVELLVTDIGNAWDDAATTIIVSPASLALLKLTKTQIDFNHGDFRLQGEIALPSTVSSLELDPIVGAAIHIGGIAAIPPSACAFHVGSGNHATEWSYDNGSGPGQIDRFDIDWGGTRLRLRDGGFPVTLTSDFITSSQSVVNVTYRSHRTGAFTLTIGSAVINFAANGSVTGNVPVDVIDQGKEVTLTLPFAITPETTFVFSGGVQRTIGASEHLLITTGTFRIEGRFDTALFPDRAATSPRTVDLSLLVGAQEYPGTAGLDGSQLNVRGKKWIDP